MALILTHHFPKYWGKRQERNANLNFEIGLTCVIINPLVWIVKGSSPGPSNDLSLIILIETST